MASAGLVNTTGFEGTASYQENNVVSRSYLVPF